MLRYRCTDHSNHNVKLRLAMLKLDHKITNPDEEEIYHKALEFLSGLGMFSDEVLEHEARELMRWAVNSERVNKKHIKN